jgi:carboxyl-terminal processing protease
MTRRSWRRIAYASLASLLLLSAAPFGQPPANYFEIAKNLELFANLYKEVNTYYVDEIDPARLMKTGVDAMLESLDPYTNYITESQIEGYRYIAEGRYNGIGADIRIIDSLPTVVAPYHGAPAQVAGLKAGDQLLSIDGRETKGRTTDDIGAVLKGYPGSEVVLDVLRPGEEKTRRFTLIRDEVNVPNVPYADLVSDKVGYIALTTFTREAGRNVARALEDLKVEQPELKGVILDLRDNGGGLLAEAVNVTNVFVPKNELVVSTKGKVTDWDKTFKTLNAPVDETVPLVVLVNGQSASASEIVSGSIQDLDRGLLIGQDTYGKGLVQNTRDIGYNAKVKLTTAKYYIPSGRCIQAIEYKQGAPARIADDKRTAFSTRNGRKVFDGGGVRPDILLHDAESDILRTLEDNFLLFSFATQWSLRHPAPSSAADFHFEHWDEFILFLAQRHFDYDTETEQRMEDFRSSAQQAGYLSEEDFKSLEARIILSKKQELEKYKPVIVNLIEKEIASRYFFEKGRIEIGLRNDPEISHALRLFDDPDAFRKLLQPDR